jgi:hypothetical protein
MEEHPLGRARLGRAEPADASSSRGIVSEAGTSIVVPSSRSGHPKLRWYRIMTGQAMPPSLRTRSSMRMLSPPTSAEILRRSTRDSPIGDTSRTSPSTTSIPSATSERVIAAGSRPTRPCWPNSSPPSTEAPPKLRSPHVASSPPPNVCIHSDPRGSYEPGPANPVAEIQETGTPSTVT